MIVHSQHITIMTFKSTENLIVKMLMSKNYTFYFNQQPYHLNKMLYKWTSIMNVMLTGKVCYVAYLNGIIRTGNMNTTKKEIRM